MLNEWALTIFSFAAIAGGIFWVAYFGWDLYTSAPPSASRHAETKEPTTHPRAA